MKINKIFIFIIILWFSSCRYYGDFINHKYPPFVVNTHFKMRGIYFAEELPTDGKHMIFRYLIPCKDGSVWLGTGHKLDEHYHPMADNIIYWNENMFKEVYEPHWVSRYAEFNWGNYMVSGDTLSIQFFISDEFVERILEHKYQILNDTTIILTQKNCNWCKPKRFGGYTEVKFNPPIKYSYHPYPSKPDSSLAWFKHKWWYRKWLKESEGKKE